MNTAPASCTRRVSSRTTIRRWSAKYGWQAVFNTFGALAIAAEAYGLKAALGLRLLQNVFGVLFALVFCLLFSRMLARFSATAENN